MLRPRQLYLMYQAFQPLTPECTASPDTDEDSRGFGGGGEGEVTALEVQEECDMTSPC